MIVERFYSADEAEVLPAETAHAHDEIFDERRWNYNGWTLEGWKTTFPNRRPVRVSSQFQSGKEKTVFLCNTNRYFKSSIEIGMIFSNFGLRK